MPDGLKVEAIDAAQGGRLIRTLDCAVNLLPEFRAAALTKFSAAPKGTQYWHRHLRQRPGIQDVVRVFRTRTSNRWLRGCGGAGSRRASALRYTLSA